MSESKKPAPIKPKASIDDRIDYLTELTKAGMRTLRFKGESFVKLPGQPDWRVVPSGQPDLKYSIMRFFSDKGTKIHPRTADDICGLIKADPFIRQSADEEVFYRVGFQNEIYWYDLGRRVVKISKDGWTVQDHSEVNFVRYQYSLDQVEPTADGSLDQLWSLIHVSDEGDRLRLLAWILMAFDRDRQHPLLFLRGTKGSAKSTTMGIIRELIDPHTAEHVNSYTRLDGLYHSAARRWVCPIDNVSSIARELSDALCKMVTGDSFSVRLLYTDGEERIVEMKRPVIITSITEVIDFPDLQDRTQVIDLPRITGQLLTQKFLKEKFNHDRASILGALFDKLVVVLRELPNLPRGLRLKRMAEYSEFGIALSRSYGHPSNHFTDLLERREELSGLELIEGNLTVLLFVKVAIEQQQLDCNPTELFTLLRTYRDSDPRLKDWEIARSAKSMGKAIGEYLKELEAHGILIEKSRNATRRYRIDARKVSKALVALVANDGGRVSGEVDSESFESFSEPSMISKPKELPLDFNDPLLSS